VSRNEVRAGQTRALYIGSGVAAIGTIWYYYYPMVENARIENKWERLGPRIAVVSAANVDGSQKRARWWRDPFCKGSFADAQRCAVDPRW
jgi:hypothetical protein